MKALGGAPRKRCPYCKATRPMYLLGNHMEQCAQEQNKRQAVRQQELLAELKRAQS